MEETTLQTSEASINDSSSEQEDFQTMLRTMHALWRYAVEASAHSSRRALYAKIRKCIGPGFLACVVSQVNHTVPSAHEYSKAFREWMNFEYSKSSSVANTTQLIRITTLSREETQLVFASCYGKHRKDDNKFLHAIGSLSQDDS